MRPRALIVSPGDGVEVEGPLTITGWAWSGHGAIEQVLVSVDQVTVEAELAPALGRHAWRAWKAVVGVAPGQRTICARAVDSSGRIQPDEPRWNALGYGNNAAVPRRVVVR